MSATEMAMSFGMNESVISLICVAARNALTTSPVISATSRSGAASIMVISSARLPMVMTVSGLMSGRASGGEEAGGQRAHDERPAIHQHEEHQFEGQRHQDRREHHHAHRHEDTRHDEIDDHEGDEDQEADEEGGLEL